MERTVAFDVVEAPAIEADVSPQERQPGRNVFSHSVLYVKSSTEPSRLSMNVRPKTHASPDSSSEVHHEV